ncbi:heterokaryon incompatibility protein-domain-containing protein [Clohesyomyces aquaticus]|uniref:Heterokaryon incompatibility protein-domain-containing protein n=1 Tax=Clohesyomyces aquaticus TaxID=1231657 RepID=A0A1Y1YLG5_9PLEO|nr:heterokaryon incompatibility protein-domain-containing protein [Clohesyomyces aquaticus]
MRYHPISQAKNEIRLLLLLPECDGIEPQGILLHHGLDEAPAYTALSYCWGDPLDSKEISINGTSVSVTKNLYAALLHIRHRTDPKIWWIDAICINQTDDAEKSWQVQLMRDIFQRAFSATVWLGPATARTDAAMDYLEKLGNRGIFMQIADNEDLVLKQWARLMSKPLIHDDEDLTSAGNDDVRPLESQNNPMKNEEIYLPGVKEMFYEFIGIHDEKTMIPIQDLGELFSLPWWSRTWVLQEHAQARAVVFRCGFKCINHIYIAGALLVLTEFQNALIESPTFNPATEAGARVVHWARGHDVQLRPFLVFKIALEKTVPLALLLRATCVVTYDELFQWQSVFHATDPRDKIFGLLGLALDREDLRKYGLLPDYTLSCQEVYANAMKALVRQGHISILSHVQFPKTMEGLPSWAPDWSRLIQPPLQHLKWEGGFDPEYGACKTLRKMSQEAEAADTTQEGANELVLLGLVHDTIIDSERGLEGLTVLAQSDWAQRVLSWLRLLEDLTLRHKDSFAAETQRHAAMFRTSTADYSLPNGERVRMTQNSLLIAALVIYGERPEALEELGVQKTQRENGLFDGVTPDSLSHFHSEHYLMEVRHRCRNRRPFITSKGHLGLGPKHLREGDITAVLAGWQVPCVLRPVSDGKFEFVGEAYVDGIMDGEAVGDRVEGDLITLI